MSIVKKKLHDDDVSVEYIVENEFPQKGEKVYTPRPARSSRQRGGGYSFPGTPRLKESSLSRALPDVKCREVSKLHERICQNKFDEKKTMNCPLRGCNTSFESFSSFLLHYQRCTGCETEGHTALCIHICILCDSMFHSGTLLTRHYKCDHIDYVNALENVPQSEPTPSKRPRGRPRKCMSISANASEMLNKSELHVRVEKSENLQQNDGTLESKQKCLPTLNKKGRGRPRRVHVEGIPEAAANTSNSECLAEKPRPADEAVEHLPVSESKLVRRRGRPRKDESNSENCSKTQEDIESTGKVKKLGRKPKPQPTNGEILQCCHCERTFSSVGNLRYHMAEAHNRLYSKLLPEGEDNPGKILKIFKFLNCPMCGKRHTVLFYWKFHLKWCGREEEKEICTICTKSIKSMWAHLHYKEHAKQKIEAEKALLMAAEKSSEDNIESNIILGPRKSRASAAVARCKLVDHEDDSEDDCRPSKRKKRRVSESDEEEKYVEESDEDDDTADEDDESLKELNLGPSVSKSFSKYRVPGFSQSRSRNLAYVTSFELEKLLGVALRNQREFLSIDSCLLNLMPMKASFFLLPAGEAEKYLPQCKKSPEFSFSEEAERQCVERFQVSRNGQWQDLCFTGGPVWSQDWCPIPSHIASATHYVSSYSHRSWDDSFDATKVQAGAASVLIWDCGDLMESERTCKLSLVIAIDGGAVWKMKWCPAGAWMNPDQPASGDAYPRLGVLALACSAGYILVISIPHPNCISSSEGTLKVVKPSNVLKLCPNLQLESYSNCVSLDWQIKDGASVVMAGFANGTVCMWNIATSSSLLRPSTNIILPFRSFQPHLASVTDVSICQIKPDFFCTCSADRVFKLWDRKQLNCPVNTFNKTSFKCSSFPTQWPLVYAAGDDCFSSSELGNGCYALDSGYFSGQYKLMMIHRSCVQSMDFSEWCNSLVSCDSGGFMIVLTLPVMFTLSSSFKEVPSRRMVASSIKLCPKNVKTCGSDKTGIGQMGSINKRKEVKILEKKIENISEEEEVEKSKVKLENEDIEVKVQGKEGRKELLADEDCSSFKLSKMIDNYSLLFSTSVDSCESLRQCHMKQMNSDAKNCAPLQSINSVAWNRHLGAHQWLSSGTSAGFVCITRFGYLMPARFPTTISKLKLSLLSDENSSFKSSNS